MKWSIRLLDEDMVMIEIRNCVETTIILRYMGYESVRITNVIENSAVVKLIVANYVSDHTDLC